MASSSVPRAAPPAAETLLDMPSEVVGQRIVAHPDVDAASRVALFRTCHTLARMVLQHAPGSKRLTPGGSSNSNSSGGSWSSTLVHLLGTKWQPLHLTDLELKVTSCRTIPSCPPATIIQHVSHLHFHQCTLTGKRLAAWQLHHTAVWPHLQHLSITDCCFLAKPQTDMQLLQPVPLLRFLSWHAAADRHGVIIDALCRLAGSATHVRVDLPWFMLNATMKVLEQLQHLTHVDVEGTGCTVVKALLKHPALEHVTLRQMGGVSTDLSQQACRWRTLTLLGGGDVWDMGRLPLASLERLAISRELRAQTCSEDSDEEHQAGVAAGVAVLQQLHSSGRLVLQPDSGLYRLLDMGFEPASCMPAVVRLVLEAGQGIHKLQLTGETLFQQEVVPQLQHSGTVHTLCISKMPLGVSREGWAGLFGGLPTCITNVRVGVTFAADLRLKALAQGAAAALAHPLTLTLVHQGAISHTLEAELMQLAGGDGMGELGGGGGGGAGGSGAQERPSCCWRWFADRPG